MTEPAKHRRGPKTANGRAAVRHNAIKHGMASNSPVIPGMESEAEWQAHLDAVVASFAPEGYLEQLLAGRFANLFWRMNRVTRYEVAVTAHQADLAKLAGLDDG